MKRRKRKNKKGYCDERCIDVFDVNLCDYFHGKRKNSKPSCKNCIHFNVDDEIIIQNVEDGNGISKDDV